MLTKEPTAEMIAHWIATWHTYKDVLCPNRKTGQELLAYLNCKYSLTEVQDDALSAAVVSNVMMNAPIAEKLPPDTAPIPITLYVENEGSGCELYQDQHEVFNGLEKIWLGIDLASGYYMVEGSTLLWDECCAFQGLDAADIQNFYCVAQYIACLQKFGQLQAVLSAK